MKYISVHCLFLLCYCLHSSTMGQVRFDSDSLLRYSPDRQYMDYILAHPTLLWDTDSSLTGFGEAQLYYQSIHSDFRTAQTERENQAVTFKARGFNRISEKVYVSGAFLFRKTYQDSLAYSLRGLAEDGMPTYYFVPKAGKFERQTYQANAQVGYVWKPKKWRSDVELDYTHHWATRSVDPRMEHYTMQLLLKPSLSYSIGTLQTTLQGIWGYGKAQTSLSYKHSAYTHGNAFPEYHYRTNYGYGSISTALDSADMRQYDQYRGIALQGQVHAAHWNILWHAQYKETQQESTNDQRRMQHYFIKQRFTLDDFHLSLHGISRGENPTSISLAWSQRQGDDFNANLRSRNYLLDQWDVSFAFAQAIQTHSKFLKEFGVDATWNHDQRKDGSTSHEMQRTWMHIGLPLALSYVLPTQNRLRWSLRPSYRIALDNELNIPITQRNEFSYGIAYPEYYFYDTNALSLRTRLEYIDRRIMKNAHLGWYADFAWTKPATYTGEVYPGTFLYEGINTAFRLGINFYL